MGRKFEVTGKAVIYTKDGVKVVDAEVRRYFNAHQDSNEFKFKGGEPHLLIGGARTVKTDNHYAMPAYHPETVDEAVAYGKTKFFRVILDLMRLAQWEPIHHYNHCMLSWRFHRNKFHRFDDTSLDVTSDDALFKHFGFTPHMIHFIEEHYHDDLRHNF